MSGIAAEVGLKVENSFLKRVNATITDEVKERVKEFFLRSDISYTAPGIKDEIVVWDDSGKKRKRKYYLTMFLREAHAVYKDVHPEEENNCSFSLFCQLRPNNVLLFGDTPTEQCKCQIHENFFLKLEAMGISYEKSI